MTFDPTKAVNALIGAFVGDAASAGLHWIYQDETMRELTQNDSSKALFHSPPACPFYSPDTHPGHYETGQSSPYGEEGMVLLKYMAEETKGDFGNAVDFQRCLYTWAQTDTGRKNHATTLLCDNIAANGIDAPLQGGADFQANCFIKAVILTARYAGKPELMSKVEDAVRTHQNHDGTVFYAQVAAKTLESVLLGHSLEHVLLVEQPWKSLEKPDTKADSHESITWIAKGLVEGRAKDMREFITELSASLSLPPGVPDQFKNEIGKACTFPQSATLSFKQLGDSLDVQPSSVRFQQCLERNVLAGGDSCARATLLGAILGASESSGVPAELQSKFRLHAQVERMAHILVDRRMMDQQ